MLSLGVCHPPTSPWPGREGEGAGRSGEAAGLAGAAEPDGERAASAD